MILVTHFACCHQYKGYWRSCPLGWSYFTVMPGLNLRAGGAHAPEFTFMESVTAANTPEPPGSPEESRCKVIPFEKVG